MKRNENVKIISFILILVVLNFFVSYLFYHLNNQKIGNLKERQFDLFNALENKIIISTDRLLDISAVNTDAIEELRIHRVSDSFNLWFLSLNRTSRIMLSEMFNKTFSAQDSNFSCIFDAREFSASENYFTFFLVREKRYDRFSVLINGTECIKNFKYVDCKAFCNGGEFENY